MPSPDSTEAPEGATEKFALDKRLAQDATRSVAFDRHARRLCCAASFQSAPCPRCCRCVRDCPHLWPAAMFEEVAS